MSIITKILHVATVSKEFIFCEKNPTNYLFGFRYFIFLYVWPDFF